MATFTFLSSRLWLYNIKDVIVTSCLSCCGVYVGMNTVRDSPYIAKKLWQEKRLSVVFLFCKKRVK
jgi:hypothetical protein